ncbi:MAG: hypothetical protein KJ069_22215 [Anaerolineae bacterium]|nr:hypothetical protein [Anaerolineae bacterium]
MSHLFAQCEWWSGTAVILITAVAESQIPSSASKTCWLHVNSWCGHGRVARYGRNK